MVTDPVLSVQAHEAETPLELNLDQVIRGLAELQPSPTIPYLTVSLDWRPDGSAPGRAPREEPLRSQRHVVVDDSGPARRPSRQQFDREKHRRLIGIGWTILLVTAQTELEELVADLFRLLSWRAATP